MKKITKTEAKYQDHPRGVKRCLSCTMFRKPADCTLVLGDISSSGYCEHYDPKGKS